VTASAGSARPPRWWPGGLPLVLWVLTLLGLVGLLDTLIPASGLVVLVALVAGAGSLVGRFRRRARGVERQQLRWLAWGATLAALALLLAVAELVVHGDTPLFQAMVGACLALLSLATGAAILRYRLYDIDRVISRTLATGCSRSCWGPPTPGWCWGSAGSFPRAPAWRWGFSGRLRHQVDLDGLTAELLGVVDQAMQPTRASLWLRPHARP
jgi:hypothetical protein